MTVIEGTILSDLADFKTDVQTSVSLESLYDTYARELLGYLRALTGHDALAEDALQEVFVRLAKRTAKLSRIKNLQAYLYQTARNEGLRQIKREKRIKEREARAGETPLFEADPGSGDQAETIAALEKAVRRLPKEQREAVFLKCVEGFSFEQIGQVTSVSKDTAASRYRYGISKLHTDLGADTNGS